MKLIFNILADSQMAPLESPTWAWIILLVILTLPWIGLIVYVCTLKYRVRIFVNGHLISTTYLKAGQSIRDHVILPYLENTFVELYLDENLTEKFVQDEMPKQNLKLYVKYIENTSI
jgi:hypothetical protein